MKVVPVTDFLNVPVPPIDEVGVPITAPVPEGEADIIPGLLPRRGQLVIAGETEVGKSLVALEICSSLITKTPLWGELEPTHQARRILYILGEHYNEVIQRLWQVTQLPMTDQVILVGPQQLGLDKWLVAGGKANPLAVDKLSKWSEGCDLVVFDPFSAFITGQDVENDNTQMRLLLDTMSLVAQNVGASCLVLAHQGKPQMDKFGKENARKSYAIRGASSAEDAATNIFYMGKTNTESGLIVTLTKRKYKGIAPDEYKLGRNPETLVHSLLGNRPAVEMEKIVTQAKVARVQAHFPTMTLTDIVKLVAGVEGKSERTIWRALQGT